MNWFRSLIHFGRCTRRPFRPTIVPLEARVCTDAAALAAPSLPVGIVPESTRQVLPVVGAGYEPGSVVCWNGRPMRTAFVSSTELLVFIPRLINLRRNGHLVPRYTLEERRPNLLSVLTPGVGMSPATNLLVIEVPDPGNPNDPLDPV